MNQFIDNPDLFSFVKTNNKTIQPLYDIRTINDSRDGMNVTYPLVQNSHINRIKMNQHLQDSAFSTLKESIVNYCLGSQKKTLIKTYSTVVKTKQQFKTLQIDIKEILTNFATKIEVITSSIYNYLGKLQQQNVFLKQTIQKLSKEKENALEENKTLKQHLEDWELAKIRRLSRQQNKERNYKPIEPISFDQEKYQLTFDNNSVEPINIQYNKENVTEKSAAYLSPTKQQHKNKQNILQIIHKTLQKSNSSNNNHPSNPHNLNVSSPFSSNSKHQSRKLSVVSRMKMI